MEGGKKGKVVVVMGATATGKSKLAIDLALRFGGEVVNSDKIQVHDGLDVVTNKVTDEERAGVPHHLIGGVHPDADYGVDDFRRDADRAVCSVLARGRVPIIAGGSNRFLEALLDGGDFRLRHELCFLWVDAQLPVLHGYVRHRVDRMLDQGLVREVRELFHTSRDYTRGIRRSIGVPEMDAYLRHEATAPAAAAGAALLAAAVSEIKANTWRLARRQLVKIHRLRRLPGWSLRRLDVTRVLALKLQEETPNSKAAERVAWEADVVAPAARVVDMFLHGGGPENGTTANNNAVAALPETCCALRLIEPTLASPRPAAAV
uniref:adenylate dimethylallyltransferase (ADP/ATP-dependent) n=1 Tax=Leersia perrieri TaxID=77586 RepID=A0A0D9V1A2_9ORYZ